MKNTYNVYMEFMREIEGALGADTFRIRYTVVGGRGGYFENVYRLAAFSESEVVIRGRRETVVVSGEGLTLGKYHAGDLVIAGEIFKVECGDVSSRTP